ncbi:MAG: DUF5320 domain-containing protein [Candidatus Zophobacter franzmannii]|nr:DUF5320 domain-containing protein [Candidatus Zophobacter franzmannii]
MPRGDRTGPEGRGSMTGRGLGDCNTGSGVRGRFLGRRGGGGRGLGRGFGNGAGYRANEVTYSPASEKSALEAEVSMLRDELAAVEKRLTEVQKKD